MHKKLESWYKQNKRELPWRKNKDPYKIWISEVMLQQTTSTAVKPYYDNFINKFPTLKSLAASPLSKVLENWSGLGYYSRARNLHNASKIMIDKFPRTADELIKLPGFGPYTSRAVSSIAFNEPVGVLDGNVIRFVSRYYGIKSQWWKTQPRKQLQEIVDKLAAQSEPNILNQALMEMGATICTPKNPSCMLCPVHKKCVAFKTKKTNVLPLKKPRKKMEIWQLDSDIYVLNNKIAMIKNNFAPFLKGQYLLPGRAKKLKSRPKTYDYKHTITHHNIYVKTKVCKSLCKKIPKSKLIWVHSKNMGQVAPASLISKALKLHLL